jgi:hypothetical protein
VLAFRSGLFVYFISAFKCYFEVRMSEKVSDFPHLGRVVCICDLYLALVVDFVGLRFILHFRFQFSNER